jgi:hypothetical protein
MYLQYFGDKHRICDSLSLRAHYTTNAPRCHLHLSRSNSHHQCHSHPLLRPSQGLQPTSAASQQQSFFTSLFYALGRRTAARQVSGTLVPQPCRLSQRREKLDLALSGAAAMALSQVVHSPTALLVETSPSFRQSLPRNTNLRTTVLSDLRAR